MSRAEKFLDDIREEFPRFEVRYKRTSPLQRAIHVFAIPVLRRNIYQRLRTRKGELHEFYTHHYR